MADWLLSREDVDEVWLLPTADHPMGKALAPHSVRVGWCEALAADVSSRCKVCAIEGTLPTPSYTIDTLRELASRFPDASFRWVMGVDLLSQVDRWKDWDAIAHGFTPIVVGRGGHGASEGTPTFPEIASSDIREVLALGAADDRVPEKVAHAIGRWFSPVPLMRHASLDHFVGVCHGFTGADSGAGGVLDLGLPSEDQSTTYRQAWVRTLASLSKRARVAQVVLVDQVHGGAVVVNPSPGGPHVTVGAGDGLVTTSRDVVLSIRTADCVPVLFASPGGIAAAHAGWRGVAADVCRETVAALCSRTGDAPADVRAVIGPHISGEAYRVGEEVVQGIEATGVPQHVFVTRLGADVRVDLAAAVTRQLNMAGVVEVARVGGCTYSEQRFHSYRRDGSRAGRQVALIARFSS